VFPESAMKLVLAFGLVLSLLTVSSTAEDFDFFYFVQQVMTETMPVNSSIGH
jgi:hypothetical protein